MEIRKNNCWHLDKLNDQFLLTMVNRPSPFVYQLTTIYKELLLQYQ